MRPPALRTLAALLLVLVVQANAVDIAGLRVCNVGDWVNQAEPVCAVPDVVPEVGCVASADCYSINCATNSSSATLVISFDPCAGQLVYTLTDADGYEDTVARSLVTQSTLNGPFSVSVAFSDVSESSISGHFVIKEGEDVILFDDANVILGVPDCVKPLRCVLTIVILVCVIAGLMLLGSCVCCCFCFPLKLAVIFVVLTSLGVGGTFLGTRFALFPA